MNEPMASEAAMISEKPGMNIYQLLKEKEPMKALFSVYRENLKYAPGNGHTCHDNRNHRHKLDQDIH